MRFQWSFFYLYFLLLFFHRSSSICMFLRIWDIYKKKKEATFLYESVWMHIKEDLNKFWSIANREKDFFLLLFLYIKKVFSWLLLLSYRGACFRENKMSINKSEKSVCLPHCIRLGCDKEVCFHFDQMRGLCSLGVQGGRGVCKGSRYRLVFAIACVEIRLFVVPNSCVAFLELNWEKTIEVVWSPNNLK